jgi:hypothetical protein
MAFSVVPNHHSEVPWKHKLNFRQNQRQRMRKSGRSFISPDFLLTSHPARMECFPQPFYRLSCLLNLLNVQGHPQIPSRLLLVRAAPASQEMQLSPTLAVGLTPDQNQERPEAIHAGGSCFGIEDAYEVQCWVSRHSPAPRLQHWKEALEATQTRKRARYEMHDR